MNFEETPTRKKGRPKKAIPAAIEIDNNLLLDINRDIYKANFYEFLVAAFPHINGDTYVPMAHVKLLCDELQGVGLRIAKRKERDKHLNINVPPRSLKSIIISVAFPVWLWLHKPNAQIITVTNSIRLAEKLSSGSKRIIKSEWFQELFGEEFKLVKDTDVEYTNNKNGARMSFGSGADIMGNSADLIILDDVMDADTAASTAERNKVLDKIRNSVFTRFSYRNIGTLINVQQRLHVEDVTGWFRANMAEYFKFIKLPSEASSERDVFPTEWHSIYENGLLCDKKGFFSREDLTLARALLGSKGYAQQHLQTPRASEGGMFKEEWFRNNIITEGAFKETLNNRPIEWQLFIDGAETASAKNDATCYLLACKLDSQVYIKEVVWVRKAFTDLVKHCVKYIQHSPVRIARVIIEGKSVGKSLISQLKQDIANIPIVEIQPGREHKAVRAESVTPYCEGNRVQLIKGSWNETFIDEVASFTNGKTGHDDSVDVLVYAIKNAKQSGFKFSRI